MRYAIWGAGKIGQSAYHAMTNKGHEIVCFIDNNDKLWGTHLKGIKIYSFSEFQVLENNCVILIACAAKNVQPIINYIKEENCEIKFEVFNTRYIYERERLISYSHPSDLEDIILYNIFKEEKNITYIDVGANDPEIYSVTKLLYDKLGARGINIEPLPEPYKMLCSNRPDDINLNVGIDKKNGRLKLYIKDGLSTFVENSIIQYDSIGSIDVEVKTLSEVCSEYVTGEISFLKVDVEGLEKNVLEGADFKNYRPWIVIVESTKPTTMEFCYDEWEYILLDNGYHYTYSCGVNRWYVANEKEYLDSRFISIDELKNKYCIFSLKLEDY